MRGYTTKAFTLKNMPIWAFHGARDTVIPTQGSIDMETAIEKVGGVVKMTVYPELGHYIWKEPYSNPELFDWFLRQKRKY
jgi:predicted peptidase